MLLPATLAGDMHLKRLCKVVSQGESIFFQSNYARIQPGLNEGELLWTTSFGAFLRRAKTLRMFHFCPPRYSSQTKLNVPSGLSGHNHVPTARRRAAGPTA